MNLQRLMKFNNNTAHKTSNHYRQSVVSYLMAICKLPYGNLYTTLVQFVYYLSAIMNNYLSAKCTKVLMQFAIRYINFIKSLQSLINTAIDRYFSIFTLVQFAQTYRYKIDNIEILIDIIFRKLYLEMYFRLKLKLNNNTHIFLTY